MNAVHVNMRVLIALAIGAAVWMEAGCSDGSKTGAASSRSDVVVYTALDQEFSEPILDDFQKASGVRTRTKYDVESTKTVGLTSEIIAEAGRPRCDLFWNNEILNTLRLEKLGLLEAYRSPAGEVFESRWKSPDGTWYGFAARARVLLVNKNLADGASAPRSINDLADSKWRGKVAIAKPLFGTTATHAACLFAYWGDERAKDFFRRLKANDVQVLGGNKRVAEEVSTGRLAFGLTDTDDAMVEVERGMPVQIVYPDQGADGLGTLFIPNTVSIVKGRPHPEAARQLLDYLLSPKVETALSEGPSVQIPLNPNVHTKVRVATPQTIRAMDVDFRAAAETWDAAANFLRDEFATGE
jgi:iron(III) transport system substrate-binding protein